MANTLFGRLRQTQAYQFARGTWWLRRPLLAFYSAAARVAASANKIFVSAESTHRAIALLTSPSGEPLRRNERLIAMMVFSDIAIDPRVEYEARALAAAGYRIKILAPDFRNSATPDWGPGVSFGLFPAAAALAIGRFPWVVSDELLQLAEAEAPLAYHCHDLPTVWAGLVAARRNGARLVVDFHEWFSENVSDTMKPHTGLRKLVYREMERLALRRADVVITVCQSIASELRWMRERKIEIVRNIPSYARGGARIYPTLREQFNIPAGLFIILYQGGVGPTRNLAPIVQALAWMPDVALVIRGPGVQTYGNELKALATSIDVDGRLCDHRLYLGVPVPSADVVAAARGADAGIWSLDPICKNFYYALPNKVFEYLAAGLPVLAAQLPEVKREIIDRGLGYGFEPSAPASIAAAVGRLRRDTEIKARVKAARFEPDWPRLPAIYDGLPNSHGCVAVFPAAIPAS